MIGQERPLLPNILGQADYWPSPLRKRRISIDIRS